MNLHQHEHAIAHPNAAVKKPLRFKLGVGLLVLYPLMLVFAAVVPFLPLEGAMKAGLVAADLAAAEGILLLGIVCVGKETYQAIKARFRMRGRSGTSSGDGRDAA